MAFPRSWSNVSDAVNNPDAFLAWIAENAYTNHVLKQFHSGATFIAGRAVYVGTDEKVYPFDITNDSLTNLYVGITETGATLNEITTVVTFGVCYVKGSGWEAGKAYYISSNGYLITSPPDVGNVRLAGVGVGVDKIIVLSSGGTGGSTPSTGDNNIDGGFANSIYLMTQIHDGGGA